MLVPSGQAEILRAAQKDEHFLRKFHELLTEILQGVLGIRTWIRFRELFKVISNLIYYSLTTLSNAQTLGEEYTGIFQTHSSGKSLQKKHVQLLMILLNSCGEKVLIDSLKQFERYIKNLPTDHSLRLEAREKLISLSVNLRSSIPFLQKLHKAVFYLNGEYYQFEKRITSTKYMLVRHWLKDKTTLPAFRLLGIVSFIHLGFNMIFTAMTKKKSLQTVESTISKSNKNADRKNICPLCLNAYQNLSTIPCGHLFCWECIIPWLQERPQCPLCRKMTKPSRVVYLQNYVLS